MSLSTIGNQLNAAGSFASGANIGQSAIDSRLRRQQLQDQYNIQNRQVALQEQEYAQKLQQQEYIKSLLTKETENDPGEVLPKIYAINPEMAKGIATATQNNFQERYQEANLLLNLKAEDKQFYYEGIKDKLQKQYPNIQFGDKFSPELQRQLKREADFVKTKINTIYELQETARGLENYNKITGELGGPIATSKRPMGEAAPSAVREYQYFNSLDPQAKAAYLNLKRNTLGEGMTFDEQGNVVPLQGYIPSKSDVEAGKSSGKKRGELETEKQFAAPKVYSSMQNSFAKNNNVIQTIDEISPNVSNLTAGFGGTQLAKIPGSDARDLRRQLDTIVANLGFDELQEMRNNSPTGGALGQVAVEEIKFLQSVKANLEQDQSPKQLKRNLEKAKNQIISSQNRVRAAYDREFGSVSPEQTTSPKDFGGFKLIKVRDK